MALPIISENVSQTELDDMMDNALTASNFLKAISHEGRLMILCHLASGEKSVTELESLLASRQAAVKNVCAANTITGKVSSKLAQRSSCSMSGGMSPGSAT